MSVGGESGARGARGEWGGRGGCLPPYCSGNCEMEAVCVCVCVCVCVVCVQKDKVEKTDRTERELKCLRV